MKNLIIKTIFISAILFLGLFFGIFALVSVCAPKTMSDVYAELGMKTLSVNCSDIYYNNSSDINDQFVMFNKSVKTKNYDLTVKYAEKLVKHQYINEFVDYLNEKNATNVYLQNEKNRIYKKLVEGLYKSKRTILAKDRAFELLNKSEIGANFCFAVDGLPKTCKFSSDEKELIKTKYQQMLDFFNETTSFTKGVVAVRLSEMLDVILRFEDFNLYENDFNLIKTELENWQ